MPADGDEGSVLGTPVLFLIFNRPDTTTRVFEAIREARPSRLYVAADGPRADKEGETQRCLETRKITEAVDWPCEVRRLYREENLGCKLAVSSAITWFFTHEEEGIILEDDCLPDQSFFPFCAAMLERYRDDGRIMMVLGTSLLPPGGGPDADYLFTQYFLIWGWATWRRAWEKYDIEMREWPAFRDSDGLYRAYRDRELADHVEDVYEATYRGRIDSWDMQWFLTCLAADGVALMSRRNLVSNIGLDGIHSDGTAMRIHLLPTCSVDVANLSHPREVAVDPKVEKRLIRNVKYLIEYRWMKGKLHARGILESTYSVLSAINRERWPYGRFRIE